MLAGGDRVDMPAPGDNRPASITIRLRDRIWDFIYAPLGSLVDALSRQLNGLQFLSIQQYLSLVFVALVALLTAVAIWA